MSHREDWPDVRAHIVSEFRGEQPGPQLEQELIDVYENNPAAILNSVPSIAKSLADNKINSGWAVLRKAAIAKAVEPEGKTIGNAKRIRNADQWLRTAGCMFDRWDEVEDELFGDRGRLREIASDKLRLRYREAWNTVRPSGVQVETDEIERASRWVRDRAATAAMPTGGRSDDEILASVAGGAG